jgi:amino acid transporter
LRSAFNVSLSITFALCALGFVTGIISILNSFSVFHRGAETTFIFGLSVIAGSAVVAFLAFAGRQAAVVMLDIADLLVAQRADSRPGV